MTYIVKMSSPSYPEEPCGAVLGVRNTGGGKSAVRDALGHLVCGVTLTICPLLSLAADQLSKLKLAAQNEGVVIIAKHLDKIRGNAARRQLSHALMTLSADTTASVFLFASPQAITESCQ